MTTAAILPEESALAQFGAEALSLVLGAGLTLGLFFGVAYFEGGEAPAPEPDFADLRALSLPMDTPPPRVADPQPAPAEATPFAGLDLGASDSPVRIAVVPPDLSQLMPVTTTSPSARIEPARLYTEFKPRTEMTGDLSRVFQQHEVDQRVTVVSRPKPYIPAVVRGRAEVLSLSALILVDANGAVGNVRVMQGSGNEYFDEIILGDLRRSWVFSPAVKQGRKVRSLVLQKVRVMWKDGSPFDSY